MKTFKVTFDPIDDNEKRSTLVKMAKVLIVEDDKVLSLLLIKMVQKMNLDVIGTVTQGVDAISKAKEHSPDLILMDIMLEDDIDGIDAMISLQNDSHKFPVIFITGNSDAYNRERAQAVNYIDYLVKPISFNILKESVDKVFTNGKA